MLWLRLLLTKIGVAPKSVLVTWSGNQSAATLANN